MFCVVKGRLLHIKRAPFTMQKGIFYNAKDALLKINKESFLQKEEYLCLRKGKRLRQQKGGEA